jgi:hypothetical protein
VLASLADLAGTASVGSGSAGGYVLAEGLGPAALAVVSRWLGRADRVVVRPVLDPADPDDPGARAVDRHDPPEAMRELVVLRDGQCVFPVVRWTPGPATSTTWRPTSTPTRAGHPVRRVQTSSPVSADDTTG